jgi:hypothetical protein
MTRETKAWMWFGLMLHSVGMYAYIRFTFPEWFMERCISAPMFPDVFLPASFTLLLIVSILGFLWSLLTIDWYDKTNESRRRTMK